MKKLSTIRRITSLLFFAAVAIASAWMAVEDVRENAGYAAVPPPYDARVVRYDGLALTRSKQAIVQVRFADGSTTTFGSKKTGRHEMFAIGESVRLLHKTLDSGFIGYEIDNIPHRYGWSVLFMALTLLASTLVAVDTVRWRKEERANKRTTDNSGAAPSVSDCGRSAEETCGEPYLRF